VQAEDAEPLGLDDLDRQDGVQAAGEERQTVVSLVHRGKVRQISARGKERLCAVRGPR
jgi:hypothetical protein